MNDERPSTVNSIEGREGSEGSLLSQHEVNEVLQCSELSQADRLLLLRAKWLMAKFKDWDEAMDTDKQGERGESRCGREEPSSPSPFEKVKGIEDEDKRDSEIGGDDGDGFNEENCVGGDGGEEGERGEVREEREGEMDDDQPGGFLDEPVNSFSLDESGDNSFMPYKVLPLLTPLFSHLCPSVHTIKKLYALRASGS